MRHLITAVLLFLFFTILTGLAYPLLVTGIAQAVFPRQADGDPDLIGQSFKSPRYFWSRPSATDYHFSGGSNLGPTNPALTERIRGKGEIPVDLVTASGSGLDPHISPAAALYQVDRVAAARGLDSAAVRGLVEKNTEGRTFGLLGEPRVNVLRLNRELDAL